MQFFCKNKLFTLSGKNSIFDFWMGSKYASVDGSYQCLYEWGIIIVKTPCYDFLSGVGHSSFSFYQHSFKKIRQYCFLCNLLCWVYYYLEAVDQTCSVKKVSLEISQNSQENTCARVSNLIKLQACARVSLGQACNFIKSETLAQVFSCEFCEISKNTFSYRTPPLAASFCF